MNLEPVYTSREGLTATNSTQLIEFGIRADTLVLRNLSDKLAVAFKNPSEHSDALITVESKDSPFVLSGSHGISASKMWFESGSTSNHDFDLLAVKSTGQ